MTNLIRIAALLGIALTATASQGAVSTRAQCYDLVIAHCNTTAHPQPCAKGGMDQCDKEFKEFKVPTSRSPQGLKAN